MRHGINQRKLNRTSKHRLAMLHNMSMSLIDQERIITTLPKAKELRPYVERIITVAKTQDNLQGRRILYSKTKDTVLVKKLFTVLSKRYENRNGGYCRIMKYGFRKGDNAPLAVIELVDRDVITEKKG
ncbi:50S ribosomal protein L17 [Candidatus Mesenet endosymbiont of Agriotes lineatus]|uniref:50S ribosomal protein L17 n=1 Tax=Candidatus Mesenet endosymbiont of Agriotes lineatus TaxID=3077948 RepID=UPI0030D388BE